MRIISVPTEKFRLQNPIFHHFYAEMRRQGIDADDFHFRHLFARDLTIFQIHFPEHFAMNYALPVALLRSCVLIAALLICKMRGVPIVWTVHNVAPFENRNALLYRLMMRALFRLVDGCIFLSRTSEEEFRQRFARCPRAKPSALIHHPAYPVHVQPQPVREEIVLGMIGEQKPYKQPLQSLCIFGIARDLVPCRLLIAGEVNDPAPFRAALSALPERDVQWLDRRLGDDELERAAARVDFVLLPYAMITNSGAALYALSCGRAIVTSPLPLFFEMREQFGPAWVRIADGAETRASFWSRPTTQDQDMLKRKLEAISIARVAARHIAFFGRLRGMAPIAQPGGENETLKNRRPAA